MPDLYARVAVEGADVGDPYQATSAVAAVLRKKPEFRDLLGAKMSMGAGVVRDLGNLYSAALPVWVAAGLEEAAEQGLDLTGRPMIAVGYGSGDAAEAIPFTLVPGWERAAHCIRLKQALSRPLDLTQEQYEAMHDGREVTGVAYLPCSEFVITHVGERYDASFQDLGVEYYKYVS